MCTNKTLFTDTEIWIPYNSTCCKIVFLFLFFQPLKIVKTVCDLQAGQKQKAAGIVWWSLMGVVSYFSYEQYRAVLRALHWTQENWSLVLTSQPTDCKNIDWQVIKKSLGCMYLILRYLCGWREDGGRSTYSEILWVSTLFNHPRYYLAGKYYTYIKLLG